MELGLKEFAEGIGTGLLNTEDSSFTQGFLAQAALGAVYTPGGGRRKCKLRKMRKEDRKSVV